MVWLNTGIKKEAALHYDFKKGKNSPEGKILTLELFSPFLYFLLRQNQLASLFLFS